jgi:hypothetical protein
MSERRAIGAKSGFVDAVGVVEAGRRLGVRLWHLGVPLPDGGSDQPIAPPVPDGLSTSRRPNTARKKLATAWYVAVKIIRVIGPSLPWSWWATLIAIASVVP